MRKGNGRRAEGHLILAACLLGAAGPVPGGNGSVNGDGTIDLAASFRFPPSSTRLTTSLKNMAASSRLLWEASEGQLRLRNITIQCSRVILRAAPISGGRAA